MVRHFLKELSASRDGPVKSTEYRGKEGMETKEDYPAEKVVVKKD